MGVTNYQNIPVKEIIEARNALAENFISMREEIDRMGAVRRVIKRRIIFRAERMEAALNVLDNWLKEVAVCQL